MYVITGYSQKLDGLLFVSQAKTRRDALKDIAKRVTLRDWDQKTDTDGLSLRVPCKVIRQKDGQLSLVRKDYDGDGSDFEDGCPRWTGWNLYVSKKVKKGGFINDAVCW
jgi:hypothetical protein